MKPKMAEKCWCVSCDERRYKTCNFVEQYIVPVYLVASEIDR